MKKHFIIKSVLLCSLLAFTSCSKIVKSKQILSAVDSYIEFITPQSVGRLTPISISFMEEPKCPIGQAVELYPKMRGVWEYSENKATFTPDEPYKANSKLTLKANLKKLFNDDSGDFERNFYVENPFYSVEFDEIRLNSNDSSYTVSGAVTTDIPVSENEIKEVINANLNSQKKPVIWEQSNSPEKWKFSVNVDQNLDKNEKLDLKWSGKSLGLSKKQDKLSTGTKTIVLPAENDFSIIDINTEKKNTILVSFSKLLDSSQDITSFISVKDSEGNNKSNFSASIHGNTISLFSDSDWANIRTVAFEQGIKSSDGIYLAKADSVTLSDKWDLPSVRFMNSNVILPTTQGAVFPIETKNLSGVIVQVYQIYERNINQFLQDNELDETSNLYRVGEPVWEKKINFNWDNSMQNKYIPRGLDLSTLVKKYPGGMYHIRVSFRKDQIKYVCSYSHDFSDLPMPPDTIETYSVPNERSSWDYYESSNRNRNNYWNYRNDPCHPAFYIPRYNSSNTISRNVLVSDLGLMVKKDNTGTVYVTAADLRTAKPLPNVNLELINYVGSVITTGKTDSNGQALFKTKQNAFIITAKLGNQTSYLKISEGTNLSTSHFEIGGEKVTGGLKGFIYGERGVWRPGDNLYLTFVLQDTDKSLPKDIPVKFELVDPLGHTTDTQVLTKSENNFYPITTKTTADAPTGLWIGKVTIGGNTWTRNLSVEAIVPNRLSVELDSDTGKVSANNNTFTLKGAWLHGAKTPDYQADVSVAFSPAETTFDGYSEYTFTNISNDIDYSRKEIWKGKLDSDSQVKFYPRFNPGDYLPGKLKANFFSRIYEPSGAFSTQSKTMDYSPFTRYAGIKLPKGDAARNMLLTDIDHTADVVLLTDDGKPVSTATLNYAVYKIEWKWWWEKDAYTKATHVSSRYYSKISSGSVDINNGKGSFTFKVKYPDWGRYLVEVSDGSWGHTASKIVYIDWPGWAGRAQEGGTGSAAMLPLTADKKMYTPGDTASITFNSNSQASAYINLEKSGKIIKSIRIDTKEGTNEYKIPITADMAPNIYVHLSLVQPHMQTANSLPIRLYGLISVMVDNPATTLAPVITAAEKMEPNKKAAFTVSEKSGKPMTYTLAVVDEGLLGLTNFHAPDLRSQFYKKEASELENWDIYRYVINAYSGKLETLLAIGGSEDVIDASKNNENRFTPVVRYFGPFTLGAGEKRTTEFDMPYYVGAVRAIVVAGNNGAYGMAEKTVPVKSSLMVQPALPRTLGTNETIQVPVTVFNGDEASKNVKIQLTASGAIDYSKTEEVNVPALGNVVVNFRVDTNKAGLAKFETIAEDGTNKTQSSIPIEIKSRGSPVTYKNYFVVKPGEETSTAVLSIVEKGSESLKVELSTINQIDFSSRLEYLVQYPHGCIEQITSGGFPQLYIPDFTKLSPDRINEIKSNIMSVFERYPTYQTSVGAMGYWPGNTTPHAWGTCYAVHFMTEAKKLGYTVPDAVYNPALDWLTNSAAQWKYSNNDEPDSIQAYRLFVIALAGKADIGAMNRLLSQGGLNNDSRMLLASAYALAGRKDTAQQLLDGVKTAVSPYRSMGNDFGSSIREKAMYLFTVSQINDGNKTGSGAADTLAKEIADILASDRWLNTQETSWSLFSLLPYYSSKKSAAAKYTISNAVEEKSGTFTECVITEELNSNFDSPLQDVTIKNNGDITLYGTLICSGISEAGTERVEASGIELIIDRLDSLKNIKPTDEITIKVRVKNNSRKDLKNLVLTTPTGTCFEYANERLSNSSYKASNYTYQDIRDDLIYTYFDLSNGSTTDFYFRASAAYSGNFIVPAIYVQAMYDDSIKAVSPGFKVNMLN